MSAPRRVSSLASSAWTFQLASILAVGCLIFLFFFFPYTFGVLDHIVSIAHAAFHLWINLPDFQHGILVIPISLGIVYANRGKLAALPVRGSWWGFAVLGAAMLSYLIGYLADIQYLGFLAFSLTLAGLVLWLLGTAWMRAVAFPWAFLFFMWPLPFIDNLVAFPLRLIMSQGAHLLLSLLGVANVKIGTAVVSAANPAMGMREGDIFAVDVADPCSGIRSLYALLMISALYGYFTMRWTWQKWALFLAAVPLAVLGNMARIVILTYGTLLWGSAFAIGSLDHPTWFHMGAGYVVFAVALFGMLGCGSLLERIARKRETPASPRHDDAP